MLTRRRTIAGLSATGAALILPRAAAEEPEYRLGEWTGDSFAPMHAIRDGLWNRPLPTPERRVEIAILGGGLAGLAVAALLHDRDLILLERESEPGGVAKSGRWRNVDYALGSAYFVDLAEPFGAFYDMLGLRPRPVPEPVDRLLTGAPGAQDPFQSELRKPYESLKKLLRAVADSSEFPKIPIKEASDAALALDRLSLLDFLTRENVDAGLFGFIDAFCLSALGAPAGEISAYAGVNFLSEIGVPIYAFPGGNAALARAMRREWSAAAPGASRRARRSSPWSRPTAATPGSPGSMRSVPANRAASRRAGPWWRRPISSPGEFCAASIRPRRRR